MVEAKEFIAVNRRDIGAHGKLSGGLGKRVIGNRTAEQDALGLLLAREFTRYYQYRKNGCIEKADDWATEVRRSFCRIHILGPQRPFQKNRFIYRFVRVGYHIASINIIDC
jgi:hypothetical protein